MRVAVALDERLLNDLEILAVREAMAINQLVETVLREWLVRQRSAPKRERVRLVTTGHGGLRPGVDLADSASLWAALDGDHAP